MRGKAGKQGARRFAGKMGFCQSAGRTNGVPSESRKDKRMPGHMEQRLQTFFSKILPVAHERGNEPHIRGGIDAQSIGSFRDGASKAHGCAIVQWMRKGDFRLNPVKPEPVKRERLEKWRSHRKWMDRRADIMHKSGQRQTGRGCSAANIRFGFKDDNRASRLRQRDCCGQSIRT